nr:OsmC family protein [Pedobacter sp. ASV19]
MTTEATVSLDPVEGGFAISSITLDLKGKVSGMDEAKFTELANAAKAGCPVSKALSATPITLNVSFSA